MPAEIDLLYIVQDLDLAMDSTTDEEVYVRLKVAKEQLEVILEKYKKNKGKK